MNDDVKHLIEQLREPVWGEPVRVVNDRLRTAALFLESLAAELEQVKRERDAAVKDLHLWGCFSCKHAGYAHSEICASCVYNRNRIAKGYVSGKNRYEWRGVSEVSNEQG